MSKNLSPLFTVKIPKKFSPLQVGNIERKNGFLPSFPKVNQRTILAITIFKISNLDKKSEANNEIQLVFPIVARKSSLYKRYHNFLIIEIEDKSNKPLPRLHFYEESQVFSFHLEREIKLIGSGPRDDGTTTTRSRRSRGAIFLKPNRQTDRVYAQTH